MTRLGYAAAALAANLLVAAPAAATATPAVPPDEPPASELRVVAGVGLGVEAEHAPGDQRLRGELAGRVWPGLWLAEGALSGRLLGRADHALWARAGGTVHGIKNDCGTQPPSRGDRWDTALAFDLSLAYRVRSAAGSRFDAEAGVERVARDGVFVCGDGGLPGGSFGVRVMFAGRLALTERLGLFARVGVRTGEHVLEIGFLPEAVLGFSFER